MADFSCAYYKSILIQGRMYITQHFFAFYANWVGLYEKYMVSVIARLIRTDATQDKDASYVCLKTCLNLS